MRVDDFAQASFSVGTMDELHTAFGRAIGHHGSEHCACPAGPITLSWVRH
jgi:hypothetical protein